MLDLLGAVLAGIIGALGTYLATRFFGVGNPSQATSRRISGEWKGTIRTVDTGGESDYTFDAEYNVTVEQTGRRIKAKSIGTKVTEGFIPDKYRWKGQVVGDYLVLQGYGERPGQLPVLAGTLHIGPSGRKMRGYFTGNASASASLQTWVGYTELELQ